MKKIRNYTITRLVLMLIFLRCFAPSLAKAQEPSPEQLKEFKALTNNRVNDLQAYIRQIADKSLTERLRRKSIDMAIKLFDTTIVDDHGAKLVRIPTVQVSRRDGTKVNVPIHQYFQRLYELPQFPKVEIISYDVSYCSSYQKGRDGNYHATAFYYQQFKGYDTAGKAIYASRDRKSVETTAELAANGEFLISFGNITVVETLPILGK